MSPLIIASVIGGFVGSLMAAFAIAAALALSAGWKAAACRQEADRDPYSDPHGDC